MNTCNHCFSIYFATGATLSNVLYLYFQPAIPHIPLRSTTIHPYTTTTALEFTHTSSIPSHPALPCVHVFNTRTPYPRRFTHPSKTMNDIYLTIHHLPPEVVTRILIFLPTSYLLRVAQDVSQEWRACIYVILRKRHQKTDPILKITPDCSSWGTLFLKFRWERKEGKTLLYKLHSWKVDDGEEFLGLQWITLVSDTWWIEGVRNSLW